MRRSEADNHIGGKRVVLRDLQGAVGPVPQVPDYVVLAATDSTCTPEHPLLQVCSSAARFGIAGRQPPPLLVLLLIPTSEQGGTQIAVDEHGYGEE